MNGDYLLPLLSYCNNYYASVIMKEWYVSDIDWQVLESGQRYRLPDWLAWNEDKSLLEGVAGDADVANDYVIMVCLLRVTILGDFFYTEDVFGIGMSGYGWKDLRVTIKGVYSINWIRFRIHSETGFRFGEKKSIWFAK